MKPATATIIDLAERVGATFAQAFLAIEVADQANITQLGALKTAAFAGLFAVGKFLLIKANAFLAPAATSSTTAKT